MKTKLAILVPVLFTGVALDQLTKLLVSSIMPLGAQVTVFPGFFNLVHVHNRGAAFGLLSHLSPEVAWIFFLGTTSLVIAVVGYLWWRLPERQWSVSLGYSLILTGAVGNFIDRLRLGEVIDFLDFHYGPYHWPAFNVADSMVCVGAAFLVWVIFQEEKNADVSRAA
jgi:signal peptidase II